METTVPHLHSYLSNPPSRENPFFDVAMALYQEGQYKNQIDASNTHQLMDDLEQLRFELNQVELRHNLLERVIAYIEAKLER